ncbi:protein-tyrosine phosphatase family protein [Streptomyces albicerus]|uniref:protein-tyrosine phosphatase family protein n=1 Tax=Streptomyces albicerus TaxID=2569859 RepID=UPI00124B3E58|nr:dual specificity protein phosphatase family protein [Streptomyces albicerus]
MSVTAVPSKFSASFLPLPPFVRKTLKVAGLCLLGYVALWLAATLGMLGVHVWAGKEAPTGTRVAGINHFEPVDGHLWRGSAPREAGYRALADRGVRTVVDLRAEDLSARALAEPARAGLASVRIPIRDGQTPTPAQVDTFLKTMKTSDGPVFVHCGAGVGRTGSMASAYLVRTGQASSQQAALRTLAVGPPSIEQVYYVLSSDRHHSQQPPAVVEGVSRFLDAPRRIKASL